VAAASFEEVAGLYADERPKYEHLAAELGTCIRDRLAERGLEVFVHWRAKTVQSFVKKALRKGYADPLAEIGDKAGVRVIVHFEADIPVVREVVGELCAIVREESKRDALAYDQLGYLGVHLDVQANDEAFDDVDPQCLRGLGAEVQIHTKAQSAWAVVSHELLYKSPQELSAEITRGITRLVALVELFDGEIARFRQAIEADPDFQEMVVLGPLDDEIVRFSARRPDRALSAIVVPPLVRLHDRPAGDVYPEVLKPFIGDHEEQLRELYRAYRDDERANPLLFQPEALLIFERLRHDPDRLRAAWPVNRLPLELLESLATIWGVDL
jgi:ppGpp synthetase/RelA/SpoT-type nucleotidyltranferase